MSLLTDQPTATAAKDLPPLRTRTRYDLFAPFVLAFLATASMLVNLTRWPRLEDDEGTYLGQADAILHGTITPYSYTYDHPFIAWMQMAPFLEVANALGFGDDYAIYSGRLIMAMYAAATAGLIYLITRRVGGQAVFATLASLIWITSGLVHEDGRAIYLDNVAVPWVLLALYLAITPKQHLWHYLGSGAAFGVAVLSKETMVLFGPAILLGMWQSSWPRLRAMHVASFLASGALVIVTYPLFALLKGELLPSDTRSSLIEMLGWQFGGRDGSGSFWDAGSDRHTIVTDWLYYDRWLIIIGIVAGLLMLTRRPTRPIGVAVAFGLIPVFFMTGYLPSMYHLALTPFFAISIGALLSWIGVVAVKGWRTKRTAGGALRLIGSVVALAAITAAAVVAVLPVRVERLSAAMTSNDFGQFYEARNWALGNIPKGEIVVTNGELWNDFYQAGWAVDEVIPYTKVDRDPSLYTLDPQWLVVTPTMTRDSLLDAAAIRYKQIYDRSQPVMTFGDYEIREVLP